MKYDVAVFIGRFQPLTKAGHGEVIKKAIEISENVFIGIGSANLERSVKNPFSYEERESIINSVFPQVNCIAIDDKNTDEEWVNNVIDKVAEKCKNLGINYEEAKITLIGMDKDSSSYYLKYFNFWDFTEFPKPEEIISATDVRNSLFEDNMDEVKNLVHDTTFKFLEWFVTTKNFSILKGDYDE